MNKFAGRKRCEEQTKESELPFLSHSSFLEYRSAHDNWASLKSANCAAESGILRWEQLNEQKEERDSTRPVFWAQRYASGRTPWRLDHLPARLNSFIQSLPPESKVLIPGSGEDHETIKAFHLAGHRVIAIDFCPIAVECTKKALPDLPGRIILGDFFTYDFGPSHFDFVYERTFLCSLPPRLWKGYAARVAQLLRPRGILAGFFFYGQEYDPPPYPLTESKASKIFSDRFDLLKSEPVSDSLSIFAGQEKWQEWQLRSEVT